MTGQLKVQHQVAREDLILLRPEKLGRHYHHAAQQIAAVFGKSCRLLSDHFVRHYRASLESAGVTLHEQPARGADNLYQSRFGLIGFSADRALLGQLLEAYYGGPPMAEREAELPSASEERLRERLGRELLRLYGRLLLDGQELDRVDACPSGTEASWEFAVEVAVVNPVSGQRSSLELFLDAEMVDEIIRRQRRHESAVSSRPAPLTVSQLPVRLDCVLVRVRMPLAQATHLKPGDVLLVRVADRCEVCINHLKLFTGALAQSAGALVLNSLQSAKRP